MVISAIVGVVAWVVGLFGWAQIVGSLQNVKERGTGMTLVTIIINAAIMIALAVLVWKVVLVGHIKALLIGYAVSLVMILASGKIH